MLNLEKPVVEGLEYVKGENRRKEVGYFLKNAFGFGGVNWSMVVKKVRGE